ncbi:MAG TPA: hypothetical protein PK156_38565, partial [Polyangium sp.]|nr:hypothetical protein [Polyangium sp.]
MLRAALLRGLAMVAFFAAVWIAPLQAMAAIIPICDGDAISAWAPVVPAAHAVETNPAEDCRSATINSDEHDPQVAAMCDDRAASIVAPNRIDPMTDGRIDAVSSCEGFQHGPFASTPTNNHHVDGSAWASVEPAVLVAGVAVRPRIYFELPLMFVDPGSPQAG